jgi:hypothetical protein
MKKLLIALVVGGALFGASFGAAAALNVNANTLQAGGDTNLVCDSSGVGVSWNIQWSNAVGDYVIGSLVHVTGVDEACNGSSVVVTLTDINGNYLDQKTTIKAPATDPTVDFLADNI